MYYCFLGGVHFVCRVLIPSNERIVSHPSFAELGANEHFSTLNIDEVCRCLSVHSQLHSPKLKTQLPPQTA